MAAWILAGIFTRDKPPENIVHRPTRTKGENEIVTSKLCKTLCTKNSIRRHFLGWTNCLKLLFVRLLGILVELKEHRLCQNDVTVWLRDGPTTHTTGPETLSGFSDVPALPTSPDKIIFFHTTPLCSRERWNGLSQRAGSLHLVL